MTASAQGIDVSQFQAPLTVAGLGALGLDFAYCKATEGLTITDPDLAANWAALGAWGKVRGVYHEFVPADSAVAQAQHCYAAVQAVGGLRPGDMISVVASDYAGTDGAEIQAFCAEMRSLAGPHCPVLVYTDLSVGHTLTACDAWPLWSAWPNDTAPAAADIAPWTEWTFWQWGQENGTDRDAFNGTAAALNAWVATYGAAPSPVPGPAPAPVPQPAPSPKPPAERNIFTPVDDDDLFGPDTCKALQFVVWDGDTAECDGIFGEETKKQLQLHLGVADDGIIGEITVEALQRRVGADVDGDWGPQTTGDLQRSLNSGTF